ncbi:hypothetical protein BC835DRAFT_1304355 [Cytidiella melzeri]|nr:hypothetical protein BC835DRAFT_1304355 [Cytidiella melzeri]
MTTQSLEYEANLFILSSCAALIQRAKDQVNVEAFTTESPVTKLDVPAHGSPLFMFRIALPPRGWLRLQVSRLAGTFLFRRLCRMGSGEQKNIGYCVVGIPLQTLYTGAVVEITLPTGASFKDRHVGVIHGVQSFLRGVFEESYSPSRQR